ncbi:hypothetical protein MCOR25_011079 [Pyricularia grisea]|uniref:Extracellular membrane protein CFEM domain-containing protein n=1 Tax=Pyricularia grisea TaxID=148305 RepID=A0A6P8B8I5_PYRGI|nr:uncharacterized protein PgNI_03585 [Pyricularia grisea]KAI6344612.1 hypothetical protein MCOR25_011079 [Pyricularia grisea]TLD12133.1 hypothetical protein PgNI_03585 [Pyricularia grisea]
MRPTTTILLITAGLFDCTAAFRCLIGQYGSCNFRKAPGEEMTRCAIACNIRGLTSDCQCPENFPNRRNWVYTGSNECITQTQFTIRAQCQNADPNRILG